MDLNDNGARASFIWGIADTLRGAYRPHDYGKVILPMTVLRRFDCVIADTRGEVRSKAKEYEGVPNLEHLLFHAAKSRIYNTSDYDFESLVGDAENTATNLRKYIASFSASAREIIQRFEFDNQITKLEEKGLIRSVIAAFADVDLNPQTVPNTVMGHIFENLIRRFYELANEEAGDYFTPREVIRLMVNLLFSEDVDTLTTPGIVKTLYDPAAGTGGMLSVSGDYFKELNPDGSLEVFGQDYNDESYAICRSDMLLTGQNESHIHPHNTLTEDGEAGSTFDYMLSNPPYGVDWGEFAAPIQQEHKDEGFHGRFGAGLPPKDDGALLFLQHMISKMKPVEEGGSRIGIIMSGSPLFAGAPGGAGMGAIRRWLVEEDLVEAIVAMPEQLFFNTGIGTYVWLVTNRKPEDRLRKIQLIDARSFWERMPKSLGQKRRFITDTQIAEVTRLHGERSETEHSKILPLAAFGFQRIVVERPLRLRYEVTEDTVAALRDESAFANLVKPAKNAKNPDAVVAAGVALQEALVAGLELLKGRLTTSRVEFDGWLQDAVFVAPANSLKAPVTRAVWKVCSARDPDGEVASDAKANKLPDSELRDFENVPLGEAIAEYMEREVLPHVQDAWVDERKTVVGYEIPVTRHFYRYEQPRSLSEIDEEISSLEDKVLNLLREVTI